MLSPNPDADCGPYRFEILGHNGYPFRDYISVSTSGDINLQPLPDGTAGSYTPQMRAWLVNYPDIETSQRFRVEVATCRPKQLVAPEEHFTEAVYGIGG